MSVEEIIELPGQPATGLNDHIPLGGDGFISPQSLTIVSADLESDASGGKNQITVRFDPRYTSIVSYAAIAVESGAATIGGRLEIRTSAFENVAIMNEMPVVAVSGIAATNSLLWTPPALMVSAGPGLAADPPVLRATIDNTDTETLRLRARIYNFDKRAREIAPLHLLLSSLTRSVGAV